MASAPEKYALHPMGQAFHPDGIIAKKIPLGRQGNH